MKITISLAAHCHYKEEKGAVCLINSFLYLLRPLIAVFLPYLSSVINVGLTTILKVAGFWPVSCPIINAILLRRAALMIECASTMQF